MYNDPPTSSSCSGGVLGLRTCISCGIEKPLTEFYSKGARSDSSCKPCVRARKRSEYAAKHNTKELARLKQVVKIIIGHKIQKLDEFIEQMKRLNNRIEKRAARGKDESGRS